MPPPISSSPAARENYRKALLRVEDLHGNMAVLSRLGGLLREPDSGIDDIARLLQTDGALCANVIRISNSVLYGIGARSRGIEEALIKVGYNRALSLVGAALSKRLFMSDLDAYGMTADDYWACSYFCAVLLEKHAFGIGESPEDAYLLGLLHAIGRVVINDLLRQTKVEVYWDRAIPCEEWEDILIGFRHDEAGAHLLRQWKFSPAIHERVARQKLPGAVADDPLLQLLDYARACAEQNHFRLDGHAWLAPDDHPWTRRPDFDTAQMAADIEQAKTACIRIREALRAGQGGS